GRCDAPASRMDSDLRKRPGYSCSCGKSGSGTEPRSRLARISSQRPRVIYLGRRPGSGAPPRRNFRVSAGSRRPAPIRVAQRFRAIKRRYAMATVTVPDEKKTLTQDAEIRDYLGGIGIAYERWEPAHALAPGASAAEVLAAYAPEIDRLKAEGG